MSSKNISIEENTPAITPRSRPKRIPLDSTTIHKTKTIVTRKRQPAKVVVPINLNLPPRERLEALHNLLQLEPAVHTLFRQLATQHLFHNYNLSPLPSPAIPFPLDPLAALAASFLKVYGPKLWPSDPLERTHLFDVELSTQPGNFWAFRFGILGPEYKSDGKLRGAALSSWKRNHAGGEPNGEEGVEASRLGAVIMAYFAALVDAEAGGEAGEQEKEILSKILGMSEMDICLGSSEAGSRQEEPSLQYPEIRGRPLEPSELTENDRDSSPDVPLRITSRSKSKSALPPSTSTPQNSQSRKRKASTIVVLPTPSKRKASSVVMFPGLVDRRPSGEQPCSDSGQEFCLLEGCIHRRRSMGIMVACDDEGCPTEWFHPECVGLEGRDLGDVEWRCIGCSNVPLVVVPEGKAGRGCTEELVRDMGMFIAGREEVEGVVREIVAAADTAASEPVGDSTAPLLDGPANISMPDLDLGECMPTPSDQTESQTLFTEAMNQAISASDCNPTSSEHATVDDTFLETMADDAFIQTMQSSMATSRPDPTSQVQSVLSGLSSTLRSTPSSTPVSTDTATTRDGDAMEVEQGNVLFQALATPDPPSEQERHQQQLRDHMESIAWGNSSTGIRRAMKNIDRLERSPASQNHPREAIARPRSPKRMNSSDQGPPTGLYRPLGNMTAQQFRQSYLAADPTGSWRMSGSNPSRMMPNTQPASAGSAHSRQASLDMPPPPPPLRKSWVRNSSSSQNSYTTGVPIKAIDRTARTSHGMLPPRNTIFGSSASSHISPAATVPMEAVERTTRIPQPRPPPRDSIPRPPSPSQISTSTTVPIEFIDRTRRTSHIMPPPAPQYVFAPVQPLPHCDWTLPTPRSTFSAGFSLEGECNELERARIKHYLDLTGGLGGLPTGV